MLFGVGESYAFAKVGVFYDRTPKISPLKARDRDAYTIRFLRARDTQ